MRSSIGLVALASLGSVLILTPDANAYRIGGRGKFTCAQYLAADKRMQPGHIRWTDKDRIRYYTENMSYNDWVLGYISGMNANSQNHGGDRPEIYYADTQDLFKELHVDCDAHLEATLESAIGRIVWKRWKESGYEPKQRQASPSSSSPSPTPVVAQPPPAAAASATAMVIFQSTASETDVNALLQAYKATVLEGPNAAGAYKLQFATPLTADQLKQYIEWIKSETKIVNDAAAG